MRKIIVSFAAVIALAAISANSSATTITIEFTAVLQDFSGAAADIQALDDEGISAGTLATGSLTLNTALQNIGGNPNTGVYSGATIDPMLSVGSHVATAQQIFNDVYVLNNGPEDIFLATIGVGFGGSVLQDGQFGFQLRDSAGGAWNSVDFPLGPFDLAAFDAYVPFDGFGTSMILSQTVNGSIVDMFGELQFLNMTVTDAPEPATFALLAIGLLGFGLAARSAH